MPAQGQTDSTFKKRELPALDNKQLFNIISDVRGSPGQI
jgi:hypothetical protein